MVHVRSPWIFQDLVDELDRMSRCSTWLPGAFSYENESASGGLEVKDDEATLVLDLPGVTESDLELVLENDRLRMEARREDAHAETEEVVLRERSFGEFSRDLRLPWPVKEKDVEAELRQGVLTLRLKRSPEAAPRSIKVKSS